MLRSVLLALSRSCAPLHSAPSPCLSSPSRLCASLALSNARALGAPSRSAASQVTAHCQRVTRTLSAPVFAAQRRLASHQPIRGLSSAAGSQSSAGGELSEDESELFPSSAPSPTFASKAAAPSTNQPNASTATVDSETSEKKAQRAEMDKAMEALQGQLAAAGIRRGKLLEKSAAKLSQEKVARVGNLNREGHTKRWYQTTKVERDPTHPMRYRVFVDDRHLVTPNENRLWAPSRRLAVAVAAEWDAQYPTIRPFTMPLTTLCCTTLDRIPSTRHEVVGSLLNFIHTDTVCFRGDDDREKRLVHLQEKYHDPLVDWFRSEFHVPLHVTSNANLNATSQEEITINTLRWYLHSLNDWELAGMDAVTSVAKSIVIALAVFKRRISILEGLEASRIEESFQVQQYGNIKAGHDLDVADIRVKMLSSGLFCHLLPDPRELSNASR
eukprot:TRINITY_DN9585_c0_g1_i1.p1 TRINITY_DN9585_c0_g1~~TRINITY_DN9585_c0_g1_i1.p1  ORF type:complete len:487 (+),score=101.79 TRINITY_DN9585_c0_g1_i1:138-1463(+)